MRSVLRFIYRALERFGEEVARSLPYVPYH